MALSQNTRTAPFGAISTYKLVSAIEAAPRAVQAWNTRRKTKAVLSKLTNRELEDIGLTRGDVDNLDSRFTIR